MIKIKLELWQKVILGLILGFFFGKYFGEYSESLHLIGDIFLRAIKAIAPFLVFVSLIKGVTGIVNNHIVGRLSIRALLSYFVMTVLSFMITVIINNIFTPGVGVNLQPIDVDANINLYAVKKFNILDFIVNIVPNNIVVAFIEMNVLQIVFIAIFIGLVTNTLEKTVKDKIIRVNQHCVNLLMLMIHAIMALSPYAIFVFIAKIVHTTGTDLFYQLSHFFLAVALIMFIQYLLFGVLIFVFAHISPIPFYKKSLMYQGVALSTSSTKAALPTTISVAKNQLGISDLHSLLILPLGATVNMSGMVIYFTTIVMFLSQSLGIELTVLNYFSLFLIVFFSSIGGAGIPSGTIIMLPTVLMSLGLSIGYMPIFIGIDRIEDMLRTTLSITGDAAVALILDARANTLNKKKYYFYK